MERYTAAQVVAYLRHLVREVVANVHGANQPQRFTAAARILGVSARQLKKLYYSEIRIVAAHEYLNLVQLAQEHRRARLRRQEDDVAETDAALRAFAPFPFPDSPGTGAKSEGKPGRRHSLDGSRFVSRDR